MLTLLFLFALKVVTPGEIACVGSIQGSNAPMDVYIAGVEQEGPMTHATRGQVLYLNGPKVSSLQTGIVQRVIRPEGKVHDPLTGEALGTYYKDLGTIQIEAVEQGSATARVLLSCQEMLKGDLVIPAMAKPEVEFSGSMSNALTPVSRNGLVSTIVLGKNDAQELGAGHFCFIGLGGREGVKVGDRFTVFRPNPAFNARDLEVSGSGAGSTYSPERGWNYRNRVKGLLGNRKLPPRVLGDIIIVETGDGASTGKIVNSLSEIHLGDFVVKR
jgi:hypothetical protein